MENTVMANSENQTRDASCKEQASSWKYDLPERNRRDYEDAVGSLDYFVYAEDRKDLRVQVDVTWDWQDGHLILSVPAKHYPNKTAVDMVELVPYLLDKFDEAAKECRKHRT